jgi:hypothetical protein
VEPETEPDVQRPMRRLNPTVIALLVLVALIVAIWVFAGTRNADQDKLTGNVVTTQTAGDPEKHCSAEATYDLLKRELFRRAAQTRGGDQATYDQLAGAAILRVEDPAMESQDKDTGAINCSGSVSIDLPPGVNAAGGRTSLMADVEYTIQPAADGSGDGIVLKNADALITPLASLSRTDETAQSTEPQQTSEQQDEGAPAQVAPEAQVTTPATPSVVPPPAPVAPTRPIVGRPSFDCSRARTVGEVTVCADPGLAMLDRSMSEQFGRAMASADPDQRALLVQTRSRFLRYRDHCPTRSCIGDAYNGRMKEIDDIMAGTWRPR